MTTPKVRFEGTHGPNCLRGGKGPHAWWFDGKHLEYRDAIGRKVKHGRYLWVRFKCNSDECEKVAFVRLTDLSALVSGTEGAER